MGNILKCFISCFDEEDDDGGRGGHIPYSYPQPSRLHYQPLGLADLRVPLSTPPQPRQQQLWPVPPLAHHHGVHRDTIKIAAQCDDFLNLKSTSMLPRQQQLCPVPPLAHHHGVHVHRAVIKIEKVEAQAARCEDFLNLKSTSTVPEGLARHVTAPKQTQV
uniref:Uncharacterized protein n=1 Tax=Leersia perrieri TaxID=77586 RepID=A0A0D9XY82_9ORYZ